MNITANTKVSELIKVSPEALEAIIKLSPHFSKLRNPILRKMMAPRVSIEQAAKIGKCRVEDFFSALQPLGFTVENADLAGFKNLRGLVQSSVERPEWLSKASESDIVPFDVRPIISQSKDPFNEIIKETKKLKGNQVLCVINTFEPIPLINLLNKKGFDSFVEYCQDDVVNTYFKNRQTEQNSNSVSEVKFSSREDFELRVSSFDNKLVEIDVRDLEMPMPMLTILEKLKQLPGGSALYVNHKKLPMYLMPELEEQGFEFLICEYAENDIKLLIFH